MLSDFSSGISEVDMNAQAVFGCSDLTVCENLLNRRPKNWLFSCKWVYGGACSCPAFTSLHAAVPAVWDVCRARHTYTHTHICKIPAVCEVCSCAQHTHIYIHTYTYTHTNAHTHKHTHRSVSRLHSNSSSRAFPNLAAAAEAAAVSGRISPKYIYVNIHINMHICSSSSRHSQSLYIYIYMYIHRNIHMCSSTRRNLANSSRRVAARQHALLRSPVFILPTLPAVFSRICHLMTHGSNLTWWALLCRCVSCNGSKLKEGKITHLTGGGVR